MSIILTNEQVQTTIMRQVATEGVNVALQMQDGTTIGQLTRYDLAEGPPDITIRKASATTWEVTPVTDLGSTFLVIQGFLPTP